MGVLQAFQERFKGFQKKKAWAFNVDSVGFSSIQGRSIGCQGICEALDDVSEVFPGVSDDVRGVPGDVSLISPETLEQL